MARHKKKSRVRKYRSNPIKRVLTLYKPWFVGMFILVAGFFLGSIFTKNNSPKPKVSSTVVLEETTPSIQKTDHSINIEEINKLTKQLIVEQKKTEELSQKLNSENVKLKELLVKSLNKTNKNDQKYIEALNKVENHQQHISGEKITLEQTDYYNKVRVSLNKSKEEDSLQNKVNTLIEIKPQKIEKNRLYVQKLSKESEVRENEVRSIALKRGDTLWSLARRAYGSGALYTKILDANPQITKENMEQLQMGTVIRVPE